MTQGHYNEGADTYLVYAAEDFEIAVWWFQVRQRQADKITIIVYKSYTRMNQRQVQLKKNTAHGTVTIVTWLNLLWTDAKVVSVLMSLCWQHKQ